MITLTLTLPPTTANHQYGNRKDGGKYLLPAVTAWREEIGWSIILQLRESHYDYVITSAAVTMDATFYLPAKRRADSDNLTKMLKDALQGFIYVNDRQVVRECYGWLVDNDQPRIEVTIERRGE